jgi:hypothetical protein
MTRYIKDEDIPVRKVETSVSKQQRERQEQQFIKVPLTWVHQLSKATRRVTWPVALHLLHLSWKRKSASIILSNMGLAELKVTRQEKCTALKELETLELIKIERVRRKSPRITLLE